MEQSSDFFASLAPVHTFTQVTDESRYTPLPDDWLIILSDVQGSTKAIQAGAYKNVNMIGAACIMGLLNVADETEIPYVFGGDGATLAIPPSLKKEAEEVLIRLRDLARSSFGLTLRIGCIPVQDIRANGLDVTLLKYEITTDLHLAMFSGGGLSEADRLLKEDVPDNPYRIGEDRKLDGKANLEGLSCRWEPLTSRNGQMVSLLVNAPYGDQKEKSGLYSEILSKLQEILGNEEEEFRPTSNKNMRFRWPPRGLWTEVRLIAREKGVLRTLLGVLSESLIQYYLEKTGRKAGSYDAPQYRQELLANTDFQRFDDMIRLVLDCTEEQIFKIRKMLTPYAEQKKVAFGLHCSETALMTCLVFNLSEGRHLHFVDGGNGGFALAALEMKQQLKDQAVS
ncbi:MAG: DUF3095 domain-containing protein [Sneathiellales bacterium]|nr:DUF3095 domain-containing protein [Sneathiellales bacterium]